MAGDASFDKVSLLLHCDGLDGAAFAKDSGPGGRSVSANSAFLSTTRAKYGNASMRLNGSTSYLSTPMDGGFQVGGGDFTIECFANLASAPTSLPYAFASTDDHNNKGFIFILDTTRRMSFSTAFVAGITGVVSYQSSTGAPLNTWCHLAVSRTGQVISMYIDGVLNLEFTFTSAGANPFQNSTAANLEIGRANADWYFDGWIDEWRFTNGVGRYPAAFTPPTAPFADGMGRVSGPVNDPGGSGAIRQVRAYRRDTGVLVYDGDSSPGDSEYNSVVVLLDGDTALGNTGFSDRSPFGAVRIATAQNGVAFDKSKKVFGNASIAFTGAAAQLSWASTPDLNLVAGDFCVEFFANYPSTAGSQCLFELSINGLNRTNIALVAGALNWYSTASGNVVSMAVAPTVNAWHHIAISRSGSTCRLFVDGVLQGSSTTATFPAGTFAMSVGSNRLSGQTDDYQGNLQGLRVTKGAARYTANFTPPTDRFTARATGALGTYDFFTPTLDELTIVGLDNATSGTIYDDICIRVIPA